MKLNLQEPNKPWIYETLNAASSTTRAARAASSYGATELSCKLILQITKILFHVKFFRNRKFDISQLFICGGTHDI